MSLETKLRRWFTLFVVCPTALSLLLLNVVLWLGLFRFHTAPLRRLGEDAEREFAEKLAIQAAQVEALARLPATLSLLAMAERTRLGTEGMNYNTRVEEIESNWAGYKDDSAVVRDVVNNTVADVFREIVSAGPMTHVLLTDGDGALLAASSKPEHYNFTKTPWWQGLRLTMPGALVAEGMGEGGRLGVAQMVGDPVRTNIVRGAIRAELDVNAVIESMTPLPMRGDSAVTLFDQEGVYVQGTRWVFERLAAQRKGLMPDLREGRGWAAGVRFEARAVGGGMQWMRPLRVVAIQAESRFPLRLYGPLALSLLASSGLLAGMIVSARRRMQKGFLTPSTEMLEAGDWVLQTALARPSDLAPLPGAKAGAEREPTAIQKDLDAWLRQFRLDLDDEVSARTAEMQRDLDLAKDFQQAYLNRPYPKVPAVHIEGRLRLDFQHQYKPALALGGDFFDIMVLAPDCAGVFIADVMGHGTRSALITSILRTLIGDLTHQGRNARHFITEMNKQFCGLLKSVPSPLFASAFYFVADTTARVATFSSAGHPTPFHIRRSVGRITRLEVPEPRGAALGLLPKEAYTGGHCRLIGGDVFFFFTDGLYEAHNRQGDEYGIDRLENALRMLMYKDVQHIVDGVMRSVMDFVVDEPIADDVCMVAVEITTSAAETPAAAGTPTATPTPPASA